MTYDGRQIIFCLKNEQIFIKMGILSIFSVVQMKNGANLLL